MRRAVRYLCLQSDETILLAPLRHDEVFEPNVLQLWRFRQPPRRVLLGRKNGVSRHKLRDVLVFQGRIVGGVPLLLLMFEAAL